MELRRLVTLVKIYVPWQGMSLVLVEQNDFRSGEWLCIEGVDLTRCGFVVDSSK